MSAPVEEVAASAQSLANMADTLQQAVAQFKLDRLSPSQTPVSAPLPAAPARSALPAARRR